jgi:predicted RNase H-like HicB family nuclease
MKSGGFDLERSFDVVVERDEEGYYAASVPAFPGCHTQARSPDELDRRKRETIELCLEVEGLPEQNPEFVGIQRVVGAA